ncbi:MAG: PAS domain S-box protein [Acidobacteriia bacterium]|nr:PAS domain S-box protein [Terriglobia bacterium]
MEPIHSQPSPRTPYQLLALLVVLAGAIAGVAYRYHLGQKEAIEHEVRNQLLAIADMKVKQISEWRSRRLGEARTIMADRITQAVMQRLVSGRGGESDRSALLACLQALCRELRYAGATLVDRQGRVILQFGRQNGSAEHLRQITGEVIRKNEIVVRDFHLDEATGVIHSGLNLPLRLRPESPPFGALLLGDDPSDYLYPLLQRWPVPSRSAETLLVRRDGDQVVYLNELRHQKQTALRLRIPLSRIQLPAVRAVTGTEGSAEGVDYRGVPVFAAIRRVPDTEWFLVAKLDSEEVRAPLVRRSLLLGMLAVSLILAAGAGTAFLWRRQQLHFYRVRYESEAERRALVGHYDYLTRFANDIILLMDEAGRIVEANDRAVSAYGYSREELQQMTVRDLRHPSDLPSYQQQVQKVEERGALVFETVHQGRDGRALPVEVSVRRITIDEKRFRQSIIRDISERKAMDEKLHRTLDTLSTVIEASPAAILSLTRDFKVSTWNRSAERMFGWTAGEVIGAELPIVPDDRHEESRRINERVLSEETIASAKVEVQSKDGTRITASLSVAPLHDREGQVTGTVAILLDITRQEQAARSLEESESRFHATFDQAAVGMNHVSLDGRIIRVNGRYCEMTGYSEEELLGLSASDITHPDDVARGQELVPRLVSGEATSCSMEKRYIRKDGSVVWVQLTASLLRDSRGEPVHIIGVAEDVTGRVRAQEALQQSEERFRQVVENAPEGIVVESGLCIRYLNPAAIRMLGASSAGELLGSSFLNIVPPDDRSLVRERSEQTSSGIPVPPTERLYLRVNGEPFPAAISVTPIDYDHQPAALVFFRDITEHRRTEQERTRLEQQLLQAQKMESVGRLAGGVAHDFNNLLTVINGYCNMLLGDFGSGDSLREGLEEIRVAGERAAILTQQLLAFSRKQMVELKAINLNDAVDEAGKMLRRLISEDIDIVTKLHPGLGLVMADSGQMNQILMNLIVNARDAMPRGGTITIGTGNVEVDESSADCLPDGKPGRYVLLSVSDTGIGMSPETMQKIFEPFFTTKAGGVGTGLGLATVYGIVQQSGGWIRVSSQPEHGTTFRIYLPRTERPAEIAFETVPNQEFQHGTETVLVVEDQPEVRRLALSILKRNGYRLLEAAGGDEALWLCERYPEPIHILVTDVVMPGMTGRELADRLLASRPQLKVLYTSGYTADVIGKQGVLDPGVAYLPKPFTPAALAAKVREVLTVSKTLERILVIDDDPDIRSLFRQILTDAGYDVLTAADGRAGVRMVEENAVHLVITDLVMPEQEGLETVKVLRNRYPDLRILAISGAFGGGFLKSAAILGAQATLRKPIGAEQLLVVVRELLGRGAANIISDK